MADDPMLSLFDTDGGSFLDDLTGPGGAQSMDSNFMGQGMSGDQMIQQSPGFGVPMSDMQGNQFNPYQQASPAPEPFSNDNFNQFNASQKLQQMNMNTSHTGMPPSQQIMSPYRQQQFRPTQPSMAQPSPNMGGYGNYGAQQAGPRLPNPQQQHMQVQQNMPPQWSAGQSSPSRPHYIAQSQNIMQSQMMPTSQAMQSKFLSHRDFPQMPSSNASDFFQSSPATSTSFQHFQGNPSSNPQSMYIQNMGQRNQMPSVPISSPSNSLGHMQSSIQSMTPQQSQIPMQNQPTFQMQSTMGMPGYNNPSQQVPQQHALQYQGNFQPQQPMNNVQTSSYQRFPFGQMPGSTPTKQGDNAPQFNTSPNQNFHPSYPRMPSQRATTPSPRPPSTPEHSSTPQVNPRAPVPQMEQLVSPTGTHSNVSTPVSSPFHQPPASSSGPNFQHSNDIQVSTSLPNSNGIGPISPNVKNVGNVRMTMTNTEREIQYLQQQLNQLQAAGQTQQTQQKMLEVQEKIRSLRASQEIQRQKAQADQQGGYPGPTNGPMQTRQQPSQIQTNVAPVVQEKPQVPTQQQQKMQQAQSSVQPQPKLQPQAPVQPPQPTLQQPQQQPQVQQLSMQQPQPPVQQQQQTASQQKPSPNQQQVFQMSQPMFVNQQRPPQNVLIVTSGTQRMMQPQMQQMPLHSPQKVQVILQV